MTKESETQDITGTPTFAEGEYEKARLIRMWAHDPVGTTETGFRKTEASTMSSYSCSAWEGPLSGEMEELLHARRLRSTIAPASPEKADKEELKEFISASFESQTKEAIRKVEQMQSKRFDVILVSLLYLAGFATAMTGLLKTDLFYSILGALGIIAASFHIFSIGRKKAQ